MPIDKRMLYKYPGSEPIHNDFFDTLIVDDTEEAIAEAKADGWHLTTPEAKEADIFEEVIKEKPLTAAQKKAIEKAASTAAPANVAAAWGTTPANVDGQI